MVTLSPTPTNIEAPGLGQLHNLVVIGTGRQLFTTDGVLLDTIRKRLKLGDFAEETDQILFRHRATARLQE
jgi:hypothetical protein